MVSIFIQFLKFKIHKGCWVKSIFVLGFSIQARSQKTTKTICKTTSSFADKVNGIDYKSTHIYHSNLRICIDLVHVSTTHMTNFMDVTIENTIINYKKIRTKTKLKKKYKKIKNKTKLKKKKVFMPNKVQKLS